MKKDIVLSFGGFFAFLAFSLFVVPPISSLASVENDPSIPEIISRQEWGADESQMTWPVEYAKVQKIVIHHTASTKLVPDADGSGEYKDMVDAIYRYHTTSKTWVDSNGTNYAGFGDIGYNYLIDPEGNIYEGRKGGNGAIGGHVSGFNTGSVGISIIGNYQDGAVGQTNTTLEPQVEAAVAKLVGWIAANNGMELNASSNFCGKTIDGLVGHKDLAATQCPGNIIYSELSEIQQEASEYAGAYKNYIYQVKGDSALYMISGGYKTKFSSRDDLPSAYRNREVQYVSRSQLNAYQYKDVNILPDGTLIQEEGENTIYYIEKGKKRPLGMSEEEFLRLGFKSSEVVSVSGTEMDYYETGELIKYGPEGKLVKGADNNVYFIENGRKRLFTSATLFNHLKYSWAKISVDASVGLYLDGDVMRYPNGTLVRGANSPSVYRIENGSKRLFTSGDLFQRLGYEWSDILTVDALELNWYPSAGNMVYPDGALIRSANAPTVYLVANGQKKEITSPTLLYKLGYSFANVVEIPAESINDYPTGSKASYPDGTLVKTANSPAVYRIMSGTRQEFTSLNVFEASGAKWSNVIEISGDEMKLYPSSGIVKYPDGTLLRADGGERVYAIKDGAASWIRTAEEFTQAGYKWANIRVISPAELALYVLSDTTPGDTQGDDDNSSDTPADNEDSSDADEDDTVVIGEPNVRVSITSSTGDSISITANGNYKVEYRRANGEIYKTLQKKSGEVTETAYFDWDNYVRFIPESDNVIMEITSYQDLSWNGQTNDNKFRGVLELRYSGTSNKMWVIEEVPLESYLSGISEALASSPTEYLKAFSMMTRSYALYYVKKGGKHSGEPFDLKNGRNGNGNDQQYKGYNFEMRSPITAAIYEETRGQVIEFKGKPILSAYSSDSGGVTKSGCDVWGYCSDDFNYLDGSVKDPDNTIHDAAKIAASHGVGMSAVGAYQMANDGSGWLEIITHYYLGVDVKKYY
jgi:N-acetylmuramoyl-L-alanine amidase CwlA